MTSSLIRRLVRGLTGDMPLGEAALALLGTDGGKRGKLESHWELLNRHWDSLMSAADSLPSSSLIEALLRKLETAALPGALPRTGNDAVADRCALFLIKEGGREALPLAVAICRLLEDCVRFPSRSGVISDRGFLARLQERWERRIALLSNESGIFESLEQHRKLVMTNPIDGKAAIEEQIGRALREEEEAWLEAERFVSTLNFIRIHKEKEGYIHWFVRQDEAHGYLLDHLGTDGYWVIRGAHPARELVRLAVRLSRKHCIEDVLQPAGQWYFLTVGSNDGTSPQSWRTPVSSVDIGVSDGNGTWLHESSPPTISKDSSRQSRFLPTHYKIVAQQQNICLLKESESSVCNPVASIKTDETDDGEVLRFLERIEWLADRSLPALEIAGCHSDSRVLIALKHLLKSMGERPRSARERIRIVYVPSSLPHPLGGVPEIGAAFLRDHLERHGLRVDTLQFPENSFDQRLDELLGADAIGLGVYVHNRDEVALLVRKLRLAGYRGLIILGGPETRDIDRVLYHIDGWDAVIRGEAEEVLPEVLEIMKCFRNGNWNSGLERARLLRGVALRYADTVILCDTAGRSRASRISCPLPYDSWRTSRNRRLRMNFTRGCPYHCFFCPNHQGTKLQAGSIDELWTYTALAIADDLCLPEQVAKKVHGVLQQQFGINPVVGLRVGLHLVFRFKMTGSELANLIFPIREICDPRIKSDPKCLSNLLALTMAPSVPPLVTEVTLRDCKAAWLWAKIGLLASCLLWEDEGTHESIVEEMARFTKPRLQLETSEDNTLANRKAIQGYLERRQRLRLDKFFIFNPGQNTIRDLQTGRAQPDQAYIDMLAWNNPFRIALGTDGPSTAVLRQNNKPGYTLTGVLEINRELARRGTEVANNYILLAPTNTMLETVESLLLFLLLPIPWREYGNSVNLRVIKEDTTLATDEGILFAPSDKSYFVPFRMPEVEAFLNRWNIRSEMSAGELRQTIWLAIENDNEICELLPLLARRWIDYGEQEAEIAALGELLEEAFQINGSWKKAFRAIHTRMQQEAFVGNHTTATFRELRHPESRPTNSPA